MLISRREFLSQCNALLTGAIALPYLRIQEKTLLYKITHAKVFYQGKWQILTIGINEAGRIVLDGVEHYTAKHTYNAQNYVLSPGFIDILCDNSTNPERTYLIVEKYKITDGVTTALQMHGGQHEIKTYYSTFEQKPHYVNYGVSTKIMNIRNQYSTLASRCKKVEQCLEEGALGVSHSIEYQPTPFEELLEYAKIAYKYNRTFFLHLRYSSKEKELEGIKEAIALAERTGVRIHIDHLHSTGGTYNMPQALALIRAAIEKGLQITVCVYPYSYWATYLHSKRFDSGWQERYGLDYQDLQVVGTEERLTAESFAKYRKTVKLVAVPEGTLPLDKTVDLALKEDFCMIGSDGGIESEPRANSHPRGAGCFATSIRHGLKIGIPLEKMIEKMTILPQKVVPQPLADRARIVDGAWADIVLFDPQTINGKATVSNPNQFSEGIIAVWVNGTLSYEKGNLLQKQGKAIIWE
ncbi:MAG: nitrate reductase [Bacteroidia bacterium]|nr:nitrate reductase [Bacteroidia bacterium]MDW8302722.1 nitrate reductase [Bacteroidia bacterium]